jgi:hypothetical protein
MSYEIPEFFQYEEKIVGNILTSKQLLILVVHVLIAALILKANLGIPGLVLAGLVGISAVAFLLLKVDKFLYRIYLKWWKSIKRSTFEQSNVHKLMKVNDIKDNLIYLNDKSIRGIIRLDPFDFNLKNKEESATIIKNYRELLNSIQSIVQTTARTVMIELDDYLNLTEEQVKLTGSDLLVDSFYDYKDFLLKFIDKNKITTKLFYMILSDNNTSKELVTRIEDFSHQIENTQKMLNEMGIRNKRVEDKEALSLYSGFFDSQIEVNKSFVTPCTLSGGAK